MAVTTSGSGSDSNIFKLATGPLKVKDILINPTLKELQEYGVNFTNEPEYLTDDKDRGKGVIITAWFKIDPDQFEEEFPEQAISHRFYLYNTVRTNNEGTKTQFINKYGNITWAESLETADSRFDKAGARPAVVGEEDLVNFLKAWGDSRKKDEIQLESIDKMILGDYSELKAIEQAWKTHKLKVIVGLKDKGENKFVSVVYPKSFFRVYSETVGIKEGNGWENKPFAEGLPILFNQPFNDFSRADIVTYVPKIWNSNDLKSVQPTPDVNTGNPPTKAEDLF